MPNLAKLLKDEIARISKKEGRSLTAKLNRQSAQYRREIAALKRQQATLSRKVSFLENQERKRVGKPEVDPDGDGQSFRFQARGLKTHRRKLGLSAADYGRLIDASGQSIYMWEQGKTKPRAKQVALLASIRSLGKREAQQRLELLGVGSDKSKASEQAG